MNHNSDATSAIVALSLKDDAISPATSAIILYVFGLEPPSRRDLRETRASPATRVPKHGTASFVKRAECGHVLTVSFNEQQRMWSL
jgi:hypothetical protein